MVNTGHICRHWKSTNQYGASLTSTWRLAHAWEPTLNVFHAVFTIKYQFQNQFICSEVLSSRTGSNFSVRYPDYFPSVAGFNFSRYEEHYCSGKWESCNWRWWYEPAFSFAFGLFWCEKQSTFKTQEETIWVLHCTNNKVLGTLCKWLWYFVEQFMSRLSVPCNFASTINWIHICFSFDTHKVHMVCSY